jgi:hypothetical protein
MTERVDARSLRPDDMAHGRLHVLGKDIREARDSLRLKQRISINISRFAHRFRGRSAGQMRI